MIRTRLSLGQPNRIRLSLTTHGVEYIAEGDSFNFNYQHDDKCFDSLFGEPLKVSELTVTLGGEITFRKRKLDETLEERVKKVFSEDGKA